MALFAGVLLLLLLSPWLTARACRGVSECPPWLGRVLAMLAPALLFVVVAVPAYYYASLFSLVQLASPWMLFWPGVAGGAMYGMTVARRTRWGCLLVATLFGAGALALASIAQRFPQVIGHSGARCGRATEQLLASLPLILDLGLAAAALALAARAGTLPAPLRTATAIVVPGIAVAAAVLALLPFGFSRPWPKLSCLERVQKARKPSCILPAALATNRSPGGHSSLVRVQTRCGWARAASTLPTSSFRSFPVVDPMGSRLSPAPAPQRPLCVTCALLPPFRNLLPR